MTNTKKTPIFRYDLNSPYLKLSKKSEHDLIVMSYSEFCNYFESLLKSKEYDEALMTMFIYYKNQQGIVKDITFLMPFAKLVREYPLQRLKDAVREMIARNLWDDSRSYDDNISNALDHDYGHFVKFPLPNNLNLKDHDLNDALKMVNGWGIFDDN